MAEKALKKRKVEETKEKDSFRNPIDLFASSLRD